MLAALQEIRQLSLSIEKKVAVLTGEPTFSINDAGEEQANLLGLPVADEWSDFMPSEQYWGRAKRVSNGSKDYMVVMYDWDEVYPLESGIHYHVHDEVFTVLEGGLTITLPAGDIPLRPGQSFKVPANTPHEGRVEPNTKLIVVWIGNE